MAMLRKGEYDVEKGECDGEQGAEEVPASSTVAPSAKNPRATTEFSSTFYQC
jgi:hypothetical protein